jgi:hypothetical protein
LPTAPAAIDPVHLLWSQVTLLHGDQHIGQIPYLLAGNICATLFRSRTQDLPSGCAPRIKSQKREVVNSPSPSQSISNILLSSFALLPASPADPLEHPVASARPDSSTPARSCPARQAQPAPSCRHHIP